ncbi:hypothetical protein GCM10009733_007410 [Nonomuraea maheshkhaliensis]|uniref:Uncharacterized protein n=1 Tax=Nonomuraea maheshkhaliensis TaxID=419590 RepID=A0ABP4QQ53_9ACTN
MPGAANEVLGSADHLELGQGPLLSVGVVKPLIDLWSAGPALGCLHARDRPGYPLSFAPASTGTATALSTEMLAAPSG